MFGVPRWPVVVLLVALLLGAAIFDIRSRRIPNWLTVAGVVLGLVVNAVPGRRSDAGLLFALKGLGAAFGVYLILYLLHATSAGDVKLMAAVGALAGYERWFGIFIVTAIAGGVLALLLVAAQGRIRRTLWNVGFILSEMTHGRPAWAGREELDVRGSKAVSLPHAAVIAAGTLCYLAICFRLAD